MEAGPESDVDILVEFRAADARVALDRPPARP